MTPRERLDFSQRRSSSVSPACISSRKGLVHRGGLNADIVVGGEIRLGDTVEII